MSMLPCGCGFPKRSLWVVALLLGLSGCQTSPPPTRAPAIPAIPAEIPAGAREYRVVPGESLLQIFVYRGGPMARLGHNHVIASRSLAGAVQVTADPFATRFDIQVPVNELTVDEPALREQAGPDFSPEVPRSAREGTRKNLLSAALLDATNYPLIRLRGTEVTATGAGFDVAVEVTIKDQVHAVRVPVTIERGNDALVARGEFALRQSDLGLQPFSVAMGTLVVLDEMKVRFEISARREAGS